MLVQIFQQGCSLVHLLGGLLHTLLVMLQFCPNMVVQSQLVSLRMKERARVFGMGLLLTKEIQERLRHRAPYA
ncbi:hypothetical protein D3C86_2237670 [compost metagenome]